MYIHKPIEFKPGNDISQYLRFNRKSEISINDNDNSCSLARFQLKRRQFSKAS